MWGGKTGWIGQQLVAMLQKQGIEVHGTQARLEDRTSVEQSVLLCLPLFFCRKCLIHSFFLK